jgi:large subunit ribosomal protein L30
MVSKRGTHPAKPAREARSNEEGAGKTLRIRYVRSATGFARDQKETVRGLGLRKLNQVVERPDTPQIRGMVNKVSHLVAILESET